MIAYSPHQRLLGGAALLLCILPGCEPSFPAPRKGYNLAPFPQGPRRLPVATVVTVPDSPWRESAEGRTELALEIDGVVAVNQAFSFRGRIDGIPKQIKQVFVVAGFSLDRQGDWRSADVVSCTPQDGSIDYRVDVRAPSKPGKYHVLLLWDDGNDTTYKPFASARIVVNDK